MTEYDHWWNELLKHPLDWKLRLVFSDWLDDHGRNGSSGTEMRRAARLLRDWLREMALNQWKVTACGFVYYGRRESSYYNQVYLLSPGQEESLTL